MSFPIFPLDCTLVYVAEGAANIVYRIVLPPSSPGTLYASDTLLESSSPSTPPQSDLPPLTMDPIYGNKLVRLRKALRDLTSVFTAHTSTERQIIPLLPSGCVVEQILVKLPGGLISRCNAELQIMESRGMRLSKRHGIYLADEEYGTLVTDMSAAGNPNVLTIEFKPKWLAQSPSAPTNARRCRTCALHLKRTGAKDEDRYLYKSFGTGDAFFCPLRFMTSRPQDHLVVAQQIANSVKGPVNEGIGARAKLLEWIRENSLLNMLRDLQLELDKKGVLGAGAGRTETETERLILAMTLRDCTMFLKIPIKNDAPIEAQLGDLDVKSEAKLESWVDLENLLVNEGWYTDEMPGVEVLGQCVQEDSIVWDTIVGSALSLDD